MKIKSPPTAIGFKTALLIVLSATACSCTSSRNVDYKSYARMPSKPSSSVCRAALKSVSYTKDRAFYGNYGGSGCKGGLPTDEMDEYFRRHDVVYNISKSRRTMRLADKELVKALRKIDDESLSAEGSDYRDRAIKFMESPAAGLIGKPLTAGFWKEEPRGNYFKNPESVRVFFEPENPGIPELEPATMQRLKLKVSVPSSASGKHLTPQH